MVRQISNKNRRRVVSLWLDGNTYRKISAEIGVSIGVISSIIAKERVKVPEIDELRELKVALIQADTNLIDALRGADFLKKLNDLNIPVTRIPVCINLLNQYGEKTEEVLDSGLRLKELEVSRGKTYEDILIDAAEKVQEQQILKKSIEELNSEKKTLINFLLELDHLKLLQDKMNRYGLTLSRLDGFIKKSIRLDALGFTSKATELLASELARIGLDPQRAAIMLTKLLSQYGNLEGAVEKLFAANRVLQQDIEKKKDERESLEKQLIAFREQRNKFQILTETEENLHTYKRDQLETEYAFKRNELETRYSSKWNKIETLYNERVRNLTDQYEIEKSKLKEEIQDLKEQHKSKMKKVQELKSEDEILQANINVAETLLIKIEEKFTESRPIAALITLIKSSKAPIEKTTLLKAVLGVVEGVKTRINTNKLLVSNRLKLSGSLEEISRILDEELKFAK
jgi:hypothetical protein